MEYIPIEDADFDLVEIKNGKPYCKNHGAMNKTTNHGKWRCITVAGYRRVYDGKSVSKIHMENICKAGCFETQNKILSINHLSDKRRKEIRDEILKNTESY